MELIALWSAEQNPASVLQAFTPRVMLWDEHIAIGDLRPCLRFWQWQARHRPEENPVAALLATLVPQNCVAVFAAHPWQALLLLAGEADISWETWLKLLPKLGEHWLAVKKERFQLPLWKKQIGQLRRALARLHVETIKQLKAADAAAMQRRFGPALAEVWGWTSASSALAGFPWQTWQEPQKPHVKRFFDDMIHSWEHCEPFLREDLDRLCDSEHWHSSERVVLLTWQLTFIHMKEVTLELPFRYPHSLHKEKGQQATALLQARYAFQNFFKEKEGEEVDFPTEVPLVAWQVTVEERLKASSITLPLFAGLDEDITKRRLCELANKLECALENYALLPNFCPWGSFELAEKVSLALSSEEEAFWSLAARNRPLFLYQRPRSVGEPTKTQFLERVSGPWWHLSNLQPLTFDYYRQVQPDGTNYWVFRTEDGRWFTHGIYS